MIGPVGTTLSNLWLWVWPVCYGWATCLTEDTVHRQNTLINKNQCNMPVFDYADLCN